MSWRFTKRAVLGVSLLGVACIGVGLAVLQVHGSKLLSVQSGSMVPTLHKGDLVSVKRVPANQLVVGDVITYMNPAHKKQTITHRIVALQNGAIVTKGDANSARDPAINQAAVLGKVTHHAPLAGYAVDLVRKPLGLVSLIYLPAILIIADEWRRLMRYYKKQQHIYRLQAWHTSRAAASTAPGVTVKAIVPCIVLLLAVIVPAQAALQNTATLASSSISTAPLTQTPHVLISRVEFECTSRNTPERNNLFIITLHNASDTKVKIDGWYLESSSGRIATFKSTSLWAHRTYPEEYRVTTGLRFVGDFITLRDKNGATVDAISWGDNTSQFAPPLPAVPGGNTVTTFRRLSVASDNNTAAEWTVNVSIP